MFADVIHGYLTYVWFLIAEYACTHAYARLWERELDVHAVYLSIFESTVRYGTLGVVYP